MKLIFAVAGVLLTLCLAVRPAAAQQIPATPAISLPYIEMATSATGAIVSPTSAPKRDPSRDPDGGDYGGHFIMYRTGDDDETWSHVTLSGPSQGLPRETE